MFPHFDQEEVPRVPGTRRTQRISMFLVVAVAAAGVCAAAAFGAVSKPTVKGTIALVQGIRPEPFHNALACGAKKEAAALGYKFVVQGPPKWDATVQIPVLNAVVATKPDAMIVTPDDAHALVPAVKQAIGQGIKVVVTADQDLADPSLRKSFVASDNVAGAAVAADALAKAIGKSGKVMVMDDAPGATTSEQRLAGFQKEIKKYPNIKYLGVKWSQQIDATTAAAQVAAVIRSNPDLKGIFAVNDAMSLGSATAIREAKLTGQVKLVAFDAATIQMKLMRQGQLTAAIGQHPSLVGKDAVLQAVNALEGKPVQKRVKTPFTVVTPANMNTPAGKGAEYTTLNCS